MVTIEAKIDTFFASVKARGVAAVLTVGVELDALSIGRFHAVFSIAAKVKVVACDFRADVVEYLGLRGGAIIRFKFIQTLCQQRARFLRMHGRSQAISRSVFH